MLDTQCPTCGRVTEDWSANRPALKGQRRTDNEDRMVAYRQWRWEWGGSNYVSDIDQVEWTVLGGIPTPKLILEMTRLDGDIMPPQNYFSAILTRFNARDGQGGTIKAFASLLGVPAVIVLWRYNLSEFWIYNLSTSKGWFHLSKDSYQKWVRAVSSA